MEKPDLSIIIVSYNTAKITKECLDSILKSPASSALYLEIIIIDNASVDDSVQMLQKLERQYKNIRVVCNKENVGFGKANNQGVMLAKSDRILFLNSDTMILDDAVEKLLRFYQQNKDSYQFVGAKLFNKDGSPQPSCGPFYSLPVVFGALFLKGDYWGLTRYSPMAVKQVDWISGACILTTKELFERVGGFDEGIFMYMEEIDFFYRARKIDLKVGFYPNAHIMHLGSASSGGKTYPILQVYKGFLYLYGKHCSKLQLFLLKSMLKLKASVSVAIGRAIRNRYLIDTYEKANKLIQMA